MIRLRTASALAAGAVAALAIGGTALAAGGDPSNPAVDMSPDGDVIAAPAPSASSADSACRVPLPRPRPRRPGPSASTRPSPSRQGRRRRLRRPSIEQETEHGRAVWDVDVLAGGVEHDIDVDRATGEVLGHESGLRRPRPGFERRRLRRPDHYGADETAATTTDRCRGKRRCPGPRGPAGSVAFVRGSGRRRAACSASRCPGWSPRSVVALLTRVAHLGRGAGRVGRQVRAPPRRPRAGRPSTCR